MNDAKAPLTPPLSPRPGRGRTLRLGSRQRLFLHTSFAGMTRSAAKRRRFFSRWRRGRHRRLLPQRSSALSSRIMRNYQFTNCYIGNDRAISNGDPRVFGFPCRFPARLSILAERRAQVYDPTRFFGARGTPKNFYPEFSRAAGKMERRRYPAESDGERAI